MLRSALSGDNGGNLGRNLVQGFEVAIGAYLGYLAGGWFDRHHNSAPWGVACGVLVGCAAGMYSLIKEAISNDKR